MFLKCRNENIAKSYASYTNKIKLDLLFAATYLFYRAAGLTFMKFMHIDLVYSCVVEMVACFTQ